MEPHTLRYDERLGLNTFRVVPIRAGLVSIEAHVQLANRRHEVPVFTAQLAGIGPHDPLIPRLSRSDSSTWVLEAWDWPKHLGAATTLPRMLGFLLLNCPEEMA